MNIHYYLCILIILCGLSFFYIMYKLYVPLVMLLSREVLSDVVMPPRRARGSPQVPSGDSMSPVAMLAAIQAMQ
jgi:hypothetical protein